MASLSALTADFADEHIQSCLTLRDFAKFEATSSHLCEIIVAGDAWCMALGRELKGISLHGELREAARSKNESRHQLKAIVAAVWNVLPSVDGLSLALAELSQARVLAGAVKHACSMADAHSAACGKATRVFLGHFRFPRTMALVGIPDPDEVVASGPQEHAWCVSAALTFAFPREAPVDTTSERSGAASSEELDLWLAWRNNTVLLRVSRRAVDHPTPSDGAAPQRRGRRALSIDVRAVGSVPLLRARSSLAQIGGPWKKVSGIASAPRQFSPEGLARALAPGFPCIVCVREEEGEHAMLTSRDARALHLEARPVLRGVH